jgi:signal transduction histidine kinase
VKEVSPCRNEVLLSQGHHPEPPIPDTILEKWRKIVNLMAEQVILNLILNAADAMVDVVDRPREFTIVTRSESGGVRVEVKDNGVGIEEEKLESIFQPFYTTKASGMGLGLSISRSIVKHHGGQLIAQSNNGPGTTFCFTLT